MRVAPSEKEILENEADRCTTYISKIVRTYGLNAVFSANKIRPMPRTLNWILGATQKLIEKAKSEKAKNDSGEWFEVDLDMLTGELAKREAKISLRRSTREELREQARRETRDDICTVRVKPHVEEALEKEADKRSTGGKTISKSGLLRDGTLRGIKERESMKRYKDLIGKWRRALEEEILKRAGEPDYPTAERAKELGEQIQGRAKRHLRKVA